MAAVSMFSSGAGSWAATRRYADRHGTDGLTLLFTDTNMEDPDNYRFLIEAAADIYGVTLPGWWHRPWAGRSRTRAARMRNRLPEILPGLVWLRDGRDVWQVFTDKRMIGNTRLSTCSRTLKQRPARAWLEANTDPASTTVIIGIDWSEAHRVAAVERAYAPWTVATPLVEPPYLSREQIFAALAERGIRRPRLYDLGFAHANCGGFCVRAGQGQFAQLLRVLPERYAWHEGQEQRIRNQLGKDVAVLRDRRGGTTTPLTLRALRERIEADATQVDQLDLGGCGCFTAE